jgi:hypothetical protein
MPIPYIQRTDIQITDWIQALSSISMVLLTVALIWMTKKYVKETQCMTEIMASEFKLRASPVLLLTRGIVSISNWSKCRIDAQLRNAGTYPLTVDRALLVIWNREAQLIGAYDIEGLRCSLASNDSYDYTIEVPLNV